MPETTKTYADRLTKSSAVFFILSGAFYFTAFNAEHHIFQQNRKYSDNQTKE